MCQNYINMRKSNKERLFKAAFKLFLTKHFNGVSISDVEEASGLTRGAVFYYAKTKLDLYKQVVEYYIMNKQDISQKLGNTEFASFREFIDVYINSIERTMDSMRDIIDEIPSNSAPRSYMAMILEICSYFPDFQERYIMNVNNDVGWWVALLQHSISLGEIRPDIDILATAKNFVSVYYGQSYTDAMSMGLNPSQLREQLLNLYRLLKIPK